MVRSLGRLNCPQQDPDPFSLRSPQWVSQDPPDNPHRWWRQQSLDLPAPRLAPVPGASGDRGTGSQRQSCLTKCLTATAQQLPLTLHFFYLHLPGYALGFKIVKVSLKFHPFLKQDNIVVSREVRRGRLLHLQSFLMSGFGSIARSVCKVQSKNSGLGLVFWTISETTFNPRPPPTLSVHYLSFNLPRLLESCSFAKSLLYYTGVENSDLALDWKNWCRTNSI